MALKTFKSYTKSTRGTVLVDKKNLWKGKPVKSLTRGKTSSGGRNNCSIMTATNSKVIRGTPRINSINVTDSIRIAGSFDWRPSASKIPIGRDKIMPDKPATRLSINPPNLSVVIPVSPKPPTNKKAAINGYARENQRP